MTTPAKKPFDADSHRFGMTTPIDLTKLRHELINMDNGNTVSATLFVDAARLYLALMTDPAKHDMIPRKDVAKLVDCMEDSLKQLQWAGWAEARYEVISKIKNELAEFNANHGE